MNFVTGGTGILGTRLIFDLLSRGEKVVALCRKNSDLSYVTAVFDFYDSENSRALFNQINWVEGDLLDPVFLVEQLQKCRVVYHCAGLVSYQPQDRDGLMSVNVEGTANLVNASIAAGIEKFCHVSSVAALGPATGAKSEENFWASSNKSSIYGVSKYLGEQEVWRASEEGLKMVIVNPAIILGPANKGQSSGRLFRVLRSGIHYYTAGGTGLVDVRDVSRICIGLMHENIFSQRYILSSENLPHKKLIAMGAATAGRPAPTLAAGTFVMELAWRLSRLKSLITGKKPDITKETARAATRNNFYSNKKILDAGFGPFISVEDSLAFFAPFYEKGNGS